MIVAFVLFLISGVLTTVAAQEYELLGTVDLTSRTGHFKDSPVVLEPYKDTWSVDGTMKLSAQHRLSLDQGELFVDHGITAVSVNGAASSNVLGVWNTTPSGTADTGNAGSGGTGDGASATVLLLHDLYQGYASIYPVPAISIRAGRQRINWGAAYTFSVTDGLHPQNPDADVETGFDGASLSLRPSPDISLELAAAIQNAVATGETNDLRYGIYANAYLAPLEIAGTLVYQYRTTLRPGIVGSIPIGPFMFVAEGAVEAYDPRGEEMDYQPLWSTGAEYTWYGEITDVSIVGEYLYNGLAEHYPDTIFGDISVTSDYAGGFARRGYRYLAAGISLNVLDSWSTSHQFLGNLSDNSSYLSHSLTMVRIPGIDLETKVIWNNGEGGDEFGDLEQDFIVEVSTTVHF